MMGRTEEAAAFWLNPSAVLLRFGSMVPITRRQVFRKGFPSIAVRRYPLANRVERSDGSPTRRIRPTDDIEGLDLEGLEGQRQHRLESLGTHLPHAGHPRSEA